MKNEEYIWTGFQWKTHEEYLRITEGSHASSESYQDVTMQLIEEYLKMQLIKNIWILEVPMQLVKNM
jgi:hypothetical protein